MIKKFSFLFVVSAIQFSLFGLSDQTPSEGIPFQLLEEHLIVIQGSIGELGPLNFILDTGTATTLISPYISRKLKLKGTYREVQSAHSKRIKLQEVILPEVRIGELRSASSRALVTDLNFRGMRIDALIGLDFLRKKSFTIDYETSRIQFVNSIETDSFVHFPGSLPFVMIMMKVNGQSILLEVDTGSPGLILFKDQVKNKLEMKKGSRTQSVQHVAGRTTLKEVFLTDASIGSIHWPNLSAYLLDTGASHSSGVAGLIGFSQFGVKRLHFDFNNYILSWEM